MMQNANSMAALEAPNPNRSPLRRKASIKARQNQPRNTSVDSKDEEAPPVPKGLQNAGIRRRMAAKAASQ